MKPRKERSGLIVVTGIALLAACSDVPTSPSSATRTTPVAAGAVLSVTVVADTTVQLVSLNPLAKQTVNFGASATNKVVFPANAICDLTLSTYGTDQWNQPCASQTLPVTLTIKSWYDADGHAHSDFQPHMRFNPAADAVILTLKDRSGTVQANEAIVYCPDGATACIDESLTDPSLVTYRDPSNGNYYRRVKHFSGYNIASGYSEDSTATTPP